MLSKFRERAAAALKKALNKLDPGSEHFVITAIDPASDATTATEMGGTENQEMFSGVCANCGKQTATPIKPVDANLVYCLDCILTGKAPSGR